MTEKVKKDIEKIASSGAKIMFEMQDFGKKIHDIIFQDPGAAAKCNIGVAYILFMDDKDEEVQIFLNPQQLKILIDKLEKKINSFEKVENIDKYKIRKNH